MAPTLSSSFPRTRESRASDVLVAPGPPPSRGRRIREVAGFAVGAVLRLLIRAYQLTIAGIIPPSCRYEPSCSHYAAEAILRHGPLSGVRLALCRIVRCHPWGGSGYDPVPHLARARPGPLPRPFRSPTP